MKMKSLKMLWWVLSLGCVLGILAGCGRGQTDPAEAGNNSQGIFAKFSGEDLEGNPVDQEIIKKQKATVLNFWFNGCAACVDEMPTLEKFSQDLQKKDAVLVGVNADISGKKDAEEAKEILKKQKATYENIVIKEGDKATGYVKGIIGFPTTVVVDQEGNIVGKPICGALDEKTMKEICDRIDSMQKR